MTPHDIVMRALARLNDPLRWLDDAPDKHEFWSLLYFSKSGESDFSSRIFKSKIEAEISPMYAKETGSKYTDWRGGLILKSDISHRIAMPVKEKP